MPFYLLAMLLFANLFSLENSGATSISNSVEIVQNDGFSVVQIHINSPKEQNIHITFYSLSHKTITSMDFQAKKGNSVVDISNMAFVKKHAYFEIGMRSTSRLNSYRLVRR